MLPQSQLLADALREESDPPPVGGELRAERQPSDDPRVLQLVLKRRYHTNLLRRMLQDAGYADLAKMTAFRRERLEGNDYGD
jgi:hypothetical protein